MDNIKTRKQLERFFRLDDAVTPTDRVTLHEEATTLLSNIIERCATRVLNSGETFAVINHTHPHFFKDYLAICTECTAINPQTMVNDSIYHSPFPMTYLTLVGHEFQKFVESRLEVLRNS